MKVFKIRPEAKLPTKADGDMCYDLYACIDEPIRFVHGTVVNIPTGVKIALGEGKHASVRPRSGLAAKFGVDVLAGQIDNGYRGEWIVVLTTHKSGEIGNLNLLVVQPGDKIAQFKIEEDITEPVEEVFDEAELGETIRGEKGFGSSGN